jgi:hypothetical protein
MLGEMRFAIDFNHELQVEATEIDRVGRNGNFAAKFLFAALSIAKPLPNHECKFIGILSLVSREINGFLGAGLTALHPQQSSTFPLQIG